MKKKLFVILLILVLVFPFNIFAVGKDYQKVVSEITGTKIEKGKINFYLFRGQGCPHCRDEEAWLKNIKEDYKDYVNFYDFEVWYDENNNKMMEQVKEKLGVKEKGVPFTIIGDDYFICY